jgi:hypothetical protein
MQAAFEMKIFFRCSLFVQISISARELGIRTV